MFRIDDATAAASPPAAELAGTPGYFTEGNPATGVPATLIRASWLNAVQEELIGVLTASGVTPAKGSTGQVAAALGIATHSLTGAGYQKLPGGIILQWGATSIAGTDTQATVTLPIAFPTGFLAASGCDSGNSAFGVSVAPVGLSQIVVYAPPYVMGSGGVTAKNNAAVLRWLVIGY